MIWENTDRGSYDLYICNGPGARCDICSKAMNFANHEPYFRCAWAECDYDVCRDCGVARNGIETPKPPQTLMCSNNHYMYMRFSPWRSRGGSGSSVYCDICRNHIYNIDEGVFKCK